MLHGADTIVLLNDAGEGFRQAHHVTFAHDMHCQLEALQVQYRSTPQLWARRTAEGWRALFPQMVAVLAGALCKPLQDLEVKHSAG